MKNRFPREFYIPKGALKVTDKISTAVAYVYDRAGVAYALGFQGKAQKPAFHHRYRSAQSRNAAVTGFFESIRKGEESRKAQLRARSAFAHTYKVGDLFKTCWGYDQTNVEYFECVAVRGKMLELREIAQETSSEQAAFMSGHCVPVPGQYIGEVIRRRASEHGVKIDEVRRASFVQPKIVAGVKVYDRAHYSWGH